MTPLKTGNGRCVCFPFFSFISFVIRCQGVKEEDVEGEEEGETSWRCGYDTKTMKFLKGQCKGE